MSVFLANYKFRLRNRKDNIAPSSMILCCERDVHGIHCRLAPHLSFSRLSLHTVAAAACMSHAGVFFLLFEPSLVFVVCVFVSEWLFSHFVHFVVCYCQKIMRQIPPIVTEWRCGFCYARLLFE